MIVTLAAGVAIGIVLPHALGLDRVTPSTAAALWTVSLALRALSAVLVVIYLVLFAPATAAFDAITHWCWHAVLPAFTTHLGLDGHELGDAVIVLPATLLAASGATIACGLARAARAVRRLMAAETLGRGPQGSVIVGGSEVVMAVAGYKQPRLVVSVGALAKLDDEELAAGLEHERGHITRRHRWILLAAELFRGLGRCVPGARHANRQLAFHLERDADAWAIRRHGRAPLARVICKSALSHLTPSPGYGLLTGAHDVTRRLDELIDAPGMVTGLRARLIQLGAALGATLVLLLALAVPATIASGYSSRDAGWSVPTHCRG